MREFRCATAIAVLLLGGGLAGTARAAIIDFEDLPDNRFFSNAGLNVGSFYPGLTFGPDVTGLSVSRFGGYADQAFPPSSGDVVIWSAASNDLTITFASDQAFVRLNYTSFDLLTLAAFDAANNPIAMSQGLANSDGFVGVSSLLAVSAANIRSVTISGAAGQFVLDDLLFTAIPEPGNLAGMAFILVGLLVCRRGRTGRTMPR